jgi:hypothetical protein
MVLGLSVGCNSSAKLYEEAVAMFNAGNYMEAVDAFETLGDYRDSAEQAQEARYEDSYASAITLFDEEKFSEAAEAFEALGVFRDSAERAKEARELEVFYLIVKNIVYEPLSVSLKSIELVDINDTSISMPRNWNEWFENATVEDDVWVRGINIVGSHVVPSEDSVLIIEFIVDGIKYPIGIQVGSRFVIRKLNGNFILLPEETIELSPST